MKIIYKDMELNIKENTTVLDYFKEKIDENKNIIVCVANNEVKPLNYVMHENDEIQLLDTTTRDGRRVYIRGLLYIMSKAFYELYPEIWLKVNYQLKSSMFCKIENVEITEKMLQNVKSKMKEIVDKDIKIKKINMTKEEARKFMEENRTIIGRAQIENKEKDDVSFYQCEEYYNYFYGVMPISTGCLKVFDVMKYNDGFLLRYPSRDSLEKIEKFRDSKKLNSTLKEYDDINKVLEISTLHQINEKIRNGEGKEVILLSEALHEKKISQIADKIAEEKKRVILIAGPSSSGKTTFAKRLGIELRLNGLKPKTISVDNYFVEREETPVDENGEYDFENLESVDLKLLNDNLVRLLNGEEVDLPTFDFKTGHKKYLGKKMKLEDDEVLVMEGIHCLNDALTPEIPKEEKFKIYISALTVLNIDYYNRISTTDTRIIRRTVRDNQFRNYDALHTLKTWHLVTKGEETNIFPFQEDADVMFNSSLVYEINALKQYALPLFEKIDHNSPEYSEASRLCEFLKYFEQIDINDIPKNSLLQEFIGTGIFDYDN